MMDKTPEQLAEEHSRWFADFFAVVAKKIYHDAFLHGFKHGVIDKRK